MDSNPTWYYYNVVNEVFKRTWNYGCLFRHIYLIFLFKYQWYPKIDDTTEYFISSSFPLTKVMGSLDCPFNTSLEAYGVEWFSRVGNFGWLHSHPVFALDVDHGKFGADGTWKKLCTVGLISSSRLNTISILKQGKNDTLLTDWGPVWYWYWIVMVF